MKILLTLAVGVYTVDGSRLVESTVISKIINLPDGITLPTVIESVSKQMALDWQASHANKHILSVCHSVLP